MTKDEYVEYFIDYIKKQMPLLDYQESMLRYFLAREHERQINILIPKCTELPFTNGFDELEQKLKDGRSPIQIVIDEMQIKPTL